MAQGEIHINKANLQDGIKKIENLITECNDISKLTNKFNKSKGGHTYSYVNDCVDEANEVLLMINTLLVATMITLKTTGNILEETDVSLKELIEKIMR